MVFPLLWAHSLESMRCEVSETYLPNAMWTIECLVSELVAAILYQRLLKRRSPDPLLKLASGFDSRSLLKTLQSRTCTDDCYEASGERFNQLAYGPGTNTCGAS